MRKPISILLTILVLALGGGAAWLYTQLDQSRQHASAIETEAQQTRARYGQAIDEIAAIQDSLSAIMLTTDGKLLASDLAKEQQLSETRGDAALARIGEIKAGIDRAKSRIQELDRQLKQSGVKVAGLQRMITNLKANVSEKEAQVAALTTQVATLETRVTGLVAEVETNQGEIRQQNEVLEARRRELGTVYYAVGTKKDLTTSGVAVAKGGVLGMGKTLEATGRIDPALFTAIDTDQQSEIRIPAVRAQVVSDQPVSSYEMQVVDGQTVLRILDAVSFRTVKHLVIVTG